MPKAFRNVTKASVQTKSKGFNGKWIKNAMKSIGLTTQDSLKELYPNLAEVTTASADATKNLIGVIRQKSSDVNGVSDSLKKNKYVKAAGTAFKNALSDLKSGNLNNTDRTMGAIAGDASGDNDFSDTFDFNDDSSDVSFGDEDTPTTNNVSFNVVNQGNSDNGAMLAFQEQSKKQTEVMLKTSKATMDAQIATASASMYQMEKIGSEVISHLSNISNSLTSMVEYQNQNMTKFIEASLAYYEKIGAAQVSDEYGNKEKKLVGSDIFNSDTKGGVNIANYKKLIVQQLKTTFRQSEISGLEMLADDDTLNMLASNPLGFGTKFLTTKMITTLVGSTIDSVEKTFSTFLPSMLEKLADWGDEYSTGAVGILKQNIGKIFGIRVKQDNKIDAAKIDKGPVPFDGETKHAITEVITKELREQTSYLQAIAKKLRVKTDDAKLDAEVWDYEENKYVKVRDVQSNIASRIQDTFLNTIKSGEFGKAMNNLVNSQEGEKAQDSLKHTLDEMLTLLGNIDHSVDLKDFSKEGDLAQVANKLISNNKKERWNVRVIMDYLQKLQEENPNSLNDFTRARLKANSNRNNILNDINTNPTEYNLFASGLNGEDINKLIDREYGYGDYSKNSSTIKVRRAQLAPKEEMNTGLIGSMFSNITGHLNKQMNNAMHGNYAEANMELGGMVTDQAKIIMDKAGDTIFKPLKEAIVGPTESGEPSVLDNLKSFGSTIKEGVMTKLFGEKDEEGKREGGLLSKIGNSLSEGMGKWQEAFIGHPLSDEEKKEATDNMMNTFKDRLPATLTGTVIGAGAGTAFGGILGNLVGGPFAGAILGSITGFLSKSEKFKTMLFGEEDENGERVGGVINKKIQDFAKEHKSLLVGGATIGAGLGAAGITGGGMLGMLVGGPVAGALTGLAGTIFLKSSMFSKFLFGDEDRGQKGIISAVKDAFSAGFSKRSGEGLNADASSLGMGAIGVGAGALTGAMLTKFGVLGAALGPFGPIGGALAGLGLTIKASGGNFREWLFGKDEKDIHGNDVHKEGVIGQFKNMLNANLFKPVLHSGEYIVKKLQFTLQHDILQPFAFMAEEVAGLAGTFAGGIKETVVSGLNTFGTLIKDNIISEVGTVLAPFTETITKASEVISDVAMKSISLPFRAMRWGLNAFTSKLADLTRPVRYLLDETRRLIFKSIGKVTSYTIKGIGGILKTVSAPLRFVGGLIGTGIGKASNFVDKKLHKYGKYDTEQKLGTTEGSLIKRMERERISRLHDKEQIAKWKKETKIHDQNAKLIAKYTKNQYSSDTEEARMALRRAKPEAYRKLVGESEDRQARIAKEGNDVSKMSSDQIAKANVKSLNPIGKIVYYTQGLFNSLARDKNWDGKNKKDGEKLTQEEKDEIKRKKEEEKQKKKDEKLQEKNKDYAPKEYSFREYIKSNALGLKRHLLGGDDFDPVTGKKTNHTKNILARQVDNVKNEINGAKKYVQGMNDRYIEAQLKHYDFLERGDAQREYEELKNGTYKTPLERKIEEAKLAKAQAEAEKAQQEEENAKESGGSGRGIVKNLLSRIRGGRGEDDGQKLVSVKIESLSQNVENTLSNNSAKVAESIINEDNKDDAQDKKDDANASRIAEVKERGTSAEEKKQQQKDEDAKLAEAKEKGKSAKEQIDEKEKEESKEREEEIKENTKKSADATFDLGFHWKSIFGKKGLLTGGLLLLAPLAIKVFKWLWTNGKNIISGFSQNGLAGAIAAALGQGEGGDGEGLLKPLKTIANGVTTVSDFVSENKEGIKEIANGVFEGITGMAKSVGAVAGTVKDIFTIFSPVMQTIGTILNGPSKIVGKALASWAKKTVERSTKGYNTNGQSMADASKAESDNTNAAIKKLGDGDVVGAVGTYITDKDGNTNHETLAKLNFTTKGLPYLIKKSVNKRLGKNKEKIIANAKTLKGGAKTAVKKTLSGTRTGIKKGAELAKSGSKLPGKLLGELKPGLKYTMDDANGLKALTENFGPEGAAALKDQYGSFSEAASAMLGADTVGYRQTLGGKVASKLGDKKRKIVNKLNKTKAGEKVVQKATKASESAKLLAKKGATKASVVAEKGKTKAITIASKSGEVAKSAIQNARSHSKLFDKIVSAIEWFISKAFGNVASKLGEKAASNGGKGFAKTIIEILKTKKDTVIAKAKPLFAKGKTIMKALSGPVAQFAMGAVNGATGACRLFQVDKKYVDAKMVIISTVIGGLLNNTVGSIVDMVNEVVAEVSQVNFITELAARIYDGLSSKKDSKELEKGQNAFEKKYQKYKEGKMTKAWQKALADGKIEPTTSLQEFEQLVAEGKFKVEYKSFQDYNDDKHQTLARKLSKVAEKGIKFGKKTVKTVKSGLKKAGATIGEGINKVNTKIDNTMNKVGAKVTSAAKTAKKKVGSALSKAGSAIKSSATYAYKHPKKTAKAAAKLVTSAIKEMSPFRAFSTKKESVYLDDSDGSYYKSDGTHYSANGTKIGSIKQTELLEKMKNNEVKETTMNTDPTSLESLYNKTINKFARDSENQLKKLSKTWAKGSKTKQAALKIASKGLKAINDTIKDTLFGGVFKAASTNMVYTDVSGNYYQANGNKFDYYSANGDLIQKGVSADEVKHKMQVGMIVKTKKVKNTAAQNTIKSIHESLSDLWKSAGSLASKAVSGVKSFVTNIFNKTDDSSGSGGAHTNTPSPSSTNGIATGNGGSGKSIYPSSGVKQQNTAMNIADYVPEKYRNQLNQMGGSGRGRAIHGGRGDERVNGFSYYSQSDPRWKNKSYNTGQDNATMDNTGCGPAAMSMVASQMTGQNVDPMETASLAKATGDRDSTGTNWNFINKAAGAYGINSQEADNPSAQYISDQLDQGKPMILSGASGGGYGDKPGVKHNSAYTPAGHYVVAVGKDQDGNVLINDPRGKRYSGKYDLNDVASETGAAWSFDNGGSGKGNNIIRRRRFGGYGKKKKNKSTGGGNNFTAQDVINVAIQELGYLEKKSNSDLQSKTGNAGKANYTKYEKEVFGSNGNFWCCSFVTWCFVQAANGDKQKAKSVMGSLTAACNTAMEGFKKMNRFDKNPQPGDCIFFSGHRHGGSNHIGIVEKVSGNQVHTIEGNTDLKKGVVDNGGGVARKTYSLNNGRIMGYGHPKYDGSSNFAGVTSSDGGTQQNASTFPQYKLSSSIKTRLAKLIAGEAGNDRYADMEEASQIANLNELHFHKPATEEGLKYSIRPHSQGGWYADKSFNASATTNTKDAVKLVFEEGKRTLPRYVTEHDWFPHDIKNPKSRKSYKVGDDVHNKMGSDYKFYKFFGKKGPEGSGDIAGYFPKDYKKYKDDVPWQMDEDGNITGAGSASGSSDGTGSSSDATTETTEKTSIIEGITNYMSAVSTAAINGAFTDKYDLTEANKALQNIDLGNGSTVSASATNATNTTGTTTDATNDNATVANTAGNHVPSKNKSTKNKKFPNKVSVDGKTYTISNKGVYSGFIRNHGCSLEAMEMGIQKAGGPVKDLNELYSWSKSNLSKDRGAKVGIHGVMKGINKLSGNSNAATWHPITKSNKTEAVSGMNQALDNGSFVLLERGDPIHTTTFIGKRKNGNPAEVSYGRYRSDKKYDHPTAWYYNAATKGTKPESKQTDWWKGRAHSSGYLVVNGNGPSGGSGGGFGTGVKQTTSTPTISKNTLTKNIKTNTTTSGNNTQNINNFIKTDTSSSDKALQTVINLLQQIVSNTGDASSKLDMLKNVSNTTTNNTIYTGTNNTTNTTQKTTGGSGKGVSTKTESRNGNTGSTRNKKLAQKIAMGV